MASRKRYPADPLRVEVDARDGNDERKPPAAAFRVNMSKHFALLLLAVADFRAIAENERMGFAPWAERAREDLERMSGAAPA